MGDYEPPYKCEGAVVYRLAAPAADHYFFMNDAPEKSVLLDPKKYRYRSVSDPVNGEALALGADILLEGYSARWLRFEK
jgi:beta-galactosidase